MQLNIAVLPGDGVGPEVTREAVRVLQLVADLYGHSFYFREHLIGAAAIQRFGDPLPRTTCEACLASDAVLLGAVGDPEFDNLPADRRPEAGLLALRKLLGGFANLRPVVAYDALADCSPLRPHVTRGADILIVRELLGGIYFGEPRGQSGNGGDSANAFNTMRYSVEEIERVARVAFQAATRRRRHVTSVDKANVLETSRLWRQVVSRVAGEFPHVRLDHLYVDACAMLLIESPLRFDVVLTENLFGDILSDEAAVISSGIGVLASATTGGAVDLYEPVHGSAPDIAGRGIANPIGAILSAALLLRHTAGLEQEAADIEAAIREILDRGYRTADLIRDHRAEAHGTSQIGNLVAAALADCVDQRHPYHAV